MLRSPLTSPNCDQFAPFTRLKGDISKGLLVLADHARADLPASYGSLGLAPDQLKRHIAYDIGIEGVARGLNQRLNVPVIMANFSRLLIDPNRGEEDPTLVMRISDGALIPENAYAEEEEINKRLELYHRPYHSAVTDHIDQCLAQDIIPIVLSLHSFTHEWRGTSRPWHAGVLWDQDDRFVVPFLSALSQDPDLVVGDNEPYTGKLKGDCMYRHGTQRGLAHALLEIRQDLIESPQGQEAWAERVSGLLYDLLADKQLIAPCRAIRHFGSYADK